MGRLALITRSVCSNSAVFRQQACTAFGEVLWPRVRQWAQMWVWGAHSPGHLTAEAAQWGAVDSQQARCCGVCVSCCV